jgi:hypothetical protein
MRMLLRYRYGYETLQLHAFIITNMIMSAIADPLENKQDKIENVNGEGERGGGTTRDTERSISVGRSQPRAPSRHTRGNMTGTCRSGDPVRSWPRSKGMHCVSM